MHDLLVGLNENQAKAAAVLSGALLILAGAGSGKTKTLTHRIAYLLANGVDGSQVLAVTFTNKAAKEMKTRIEKLLRAQNFNFRMPSVGTFHSTCVRILRQDIEALPKNYTRNFVIFDSDDAKNLIKIIIKELGMDDKEIKFRAVASHISAAKNQLLTPYTYDEKTEDNRFTVAVKKIFPIYQRKLEEHNALDFDDLLQKTVQVFEQCPQVLQKYHQKWNHLMVDEYQDTNFAQYRLVRLLSDHHQNLCVIGDDHQSIYRFRGADYTNILNFEKDFPDATVIKLEQNYRSTGNILANANSLINKNETGRKKRLWTDKEKGDSVEVIETFNEKEEGNLIASRITEVVTPPNSPSNEGDFSQNISYGDVAVLYRMNAQSRSIEEALLRKQIPYQIVGGVRFFDRREIKDIIGYLRLIFNAKDDLSFLRIVNVPKRKLGAATIETIKSFARNYDMSLLEILEHVQDIPGLNQKKKDTLEGFQKLILELQRIADDKPISILLDRVVEKTDFLKSLDDGTDEGESRQQNVKELFSVAARYDAADNPLADFLEGVALISDLDKLNADQEAVTLMTIHASKGLEFPYVFLPGWEAGVFPGKKAEFDFEQLEEERRLGYVAITRAEKNCCILHTKQRTLFGKTEYSSPSKFLGELDESAIVRTGGIGMGVGAHSFRSAHGNRLPQAKDKNTPLFPGSDPNRHKIFGTSLQSSDYTISDRVMHPTLGKGTVIKISGDILSIAFAGKGIKKLLASVAPITKI
jgi:DNA helicase-2/ATP-dependent DNA helicase PcrA